MSKKLNIIEGMKMPIGTKFEVYYIDGSKDNCSAKIVEAFNDKSKKKLVWDNRAIINIVVTDSIFNATFIPIQQPVSFMEVVKTNKRVRVECEGYVSPSEYRWLHQVLYKIIENNCCKEDKALNDFITKGKWYIEESEADSNENSL